MNRRGFFGMLCGLGAALLWPKRYWGADVGDGRSETKWYIGHRYTIPVVDLKPYYCPPENLELLSRGFR